MGKSTTKRAHTRLKYCIVQATVKATTMYRCYNIMKVKYLNTKSLFCSILFQDSPGFYDFSVHPDVPGVTFIRVCSKNRTTRTEFPPELILVEELRLSHGRVRSSILEFRSDLSKGRRRRACRVGQFPELFFNWGPSIALARSCEITTKQCQNHQICTQVYVSQLGRSTHYSKPTSLQRILSHSAQGTLHGETQDPPLRLVTRCRTRQLSTNAGEWQA
jgi:hypothetical protein